MTPPKNVPQSVSTVPGPQSLAWFEAEQEFLSPGIQRIAQLSRITMSHGEGAILVDVDGNRYVDFFAGVTVASLGHAHQDLITAMEEQIRKLMVGSFTTENRAKLLELIASLTPGELTKTQLYSGGAETVEAAIRLAKSYTKKFEVVGFWGGFHGKTGRVMGLIGDESKQGWGPLPGGTHLVPYADCYRCPFKLRHPECGMLCLDFMRQSIKKSTAGSVAAILIEPIQGTAGNIVPPAEFLPGVQEIAREVGAVLIVDEIITGFGRSGTMFASEHSGVVPDIMTMGKGMGGGFPVSALVSTPEITSAAPFSKPSSSSSSYGGNPLAATAALATIRTIVRDHLVQHTASVGAMLLDGLRALQEKYEFIGDVRGKGLLIGLDLVKNRDTKEELSSQVTERIFLEALKRGLLIMGYFPRVRLNPPLVITEEQVQEGLGILDEVFQCIVDEVDYRHV
ncbi:MAG: aspartate aminotransferase family protein [Candidatus Tectimicrobiota bacterium]